MILFGLGVAMMIWAWYRGTESSIEQAIGQNQPIIAMLAAVSFLKLLRSDQDDEKTPRGTGAFFRTLVGVNFLGAAINVTALIIVADRMVQSAAFTRLQALVVSRPFCLTVMYSPFIGGMALTLATVDNSSLATLALFGFPYALLGMGLTGILLWGGHREEIREFHGYPLHFDSLLFPGLLVLLVLTVNALFPSLSVLSLIALLTPSLIFILLLLRGGLMATLGRFHSHISIDMKDMSGELWLFLCAGVFATGLSSLVISAGGWSPFEEFDAWAACFTLAGICIVSLIGIHPIICVSFLGPVIMPMDPQPNLLATVFILGWAIGCTQGPFSGTNMILQGRFGINSWLLTRWNVLYGFLMLMLGWCLLHLIQYLGV